MLPRSTPEGGAAAGELPVGFPVRGRWIRESLRKLRAQLLSWVGAAGGTGRRRSRSVSIKVPPARSMSALAAEPGLISGMGGVTGGGGGGGGPPPPGPGGGMVIFRPLSLSPPVLPPGPEPGPMANPGADDNTNPTNAAKMTRDVPTRPREWRKGVLMAGAELRDGWPPLVRLTCG